MVLFYTMQMKWFTARNFKEAGYEVFLWIPRISGDFVYNCLYLNTSFKEQRMHGIKAVLQCLPVSRTTRTINPLTKTYEI